MACRRSGMFYWRIYASLGLNELNNQLRPITYFHGINPGHKSSWWQMSSSHAHEQRGTCEPTPAGWGEASEFLSVPCANLLDHRPTLCKIPHKYYPRGSDNLCKELISSYKTLRKLPTWINMLKQCLPLRSWYWRVPLFCVMAKVCQKVMCTLSTSHRCKDKMAAVL